jgi:WD40 repeat protein
MVFFLQLGVRGVLVGMEPRTDRYWDPLPEGAIARLGTIRYRWSMNGTPVFAPDGKTLFSIGWGNTIRVWEAAPGKLIRSWRGHPQRINALGISPDGKVLASSSADKTVRLWETATGREIGRFCADEDKPWSLAFSSDGRTLAVGAVYGTITLIESPSGKEIRHFMTPGEPGSNWVGSLAFTSDGKYLASSHHSVPPRLWDANTGKEVRCFFTPNKYDQPHQLVFTPNGNFLLGSISHYGLAVWDTATGKEVHRFKDFGSQFILLSGGTKVATDQFEDTGQRVISIRQMDSGVEIQRLPVHRGDGSGLALCCPDGKTLVCFGADRMVRRWDTATGKEIAKPQPHLDAAHRNAINFVAFSPDGKTVLSADSEYEGSTIRFWDPITALQTRRFTDEQDYFDTRILSPDGKIMAVIACNDSAKMPISRIRLLEVATGKAQRSITIEGEWVACLCFSPDSRTLFTTSWKTVRYWNVATGTESRPAMTITASTPIMACNPNGKTLALAYNYAGFRTEAMLTLLDLTGQQKQKTISPVWGVCQSLAFSPNGRFLAVGNGLETVSVFDAASGKKEKEFASPGDCVAFSPDSRLLATSGRFRWGGLDEPLASTIYIWDVETGQQCCRFSGHHDPVTVLAFSTDGRLLVSGSRDSTLLVWDMRGVCKDARSRPQGLTSKEPFARWAIAAVTTIALVVVLLGVLSALGRSRRRRRASIE